MESIQLIKTDLANAEIVQKTQNFINEITELDQKIKNLTSLMNKVYNTSRVTFDNAVCGDYNYTLPKNILSVIMDDIEREREILDKQRIELMKKHNFV